MQPISPALSIKSLVFTSARTFEEFLELSPVYGDLIRRRAAEVRLPADAQHYFATFPDTLYFIALVSQDDPDTVAVLPILAVIAAASPRFELRVICDEDDLTRLDLLVDDIDLENELDDLDLPLLVVLDEEWTYQDSWGPRPAAADPYLDRWLEAHPEYEQLADEEDDAAQDAYAALLEELAYEMRVWYNSGLDQACVEEIKALLAASRADNGGDSKVSDDNKNANEG